MPHRTKLRAAPGMEITVEKWDLRLRNHLHQSRMTQKVQREREGNVQG